jgi:hypothetical protein
MKINIRESKSLPTKIIGLKGYKLCNQLVEEVQKVINWTCASKKVGNLLGEIMSYLISGSYKIYSRNYLT